jgi:asparagine synthase (glutamine-hydrolysing)
VLAAWQRWGIDAGVHLLGDFLIVVSDERNRRVVCIRDPMGQRPLFYRSSPTVVIFGSEQQQVVRHSAFAGDRTFNEAMVAEYLTGDPQTITETLWAGVRRLPPAHALEVVQGSVVARRYWDFDRGARIEYSSGEEYAEHFRDVFTRSVACRLDRQGAVGVLLSGGIDSSSVAAVAQSLLGAAGREPLKALTVAFPGRPCDETIYAQAVADRWQLPVIRTDAAAPKRDDVIALAARHLDVPPFPNSMAADPLRARAASRGVKILLTGVGGDDFFAGTVGSLAGVMRQRLGSLRRALQRTWAPQPAGQPWICEEFARRVELTERTRSTDGGWFRREQDDMYEAATSLVQVLGDEMEDRAAQASGVVQRHPFYDRRVAEFGFGLPPQQRSDGVTTKIVIRRALAGYLPALVATRRDKAEFALTYADALDSIVGRGPFPRLAVEEAGWVDGPAVRQMYERMIQLYTRGDEAYIPLVGPLWSVIALELWLEVVNAAGFD